MVRQRMILRVGDVLDLVASGNKEAIAAAEHVIAEGGVVEVVKEVGTAGTVEELRQILRYCGVENI